MSDPTYVYETPGPITLAYVAKLEAENAALRNLVRFVHAYADWSDLWADILTAQGELLRLIVLDGGL